MGTRYGRRGILATPVQVSGASPCKRLEWAATVAAGTPCVEVLDTARPFWMTDGIAGTNGEPCAGDVQVPADAVRVTA